ncbi:hypothetical protein F4860DRAFT_247745 [Xylaria cubensis]|nr:hypothetical protein F4860DRAFT_247745 [Xylaria cubensis]
MSHDAFVEGIDIYIDGGVFFIGGISNTSFSPLIITTTSCGYHCPICGWVLIDWDGLDGQDKQRSLFLPTGFTIIDFRVPSVVLDFVDTGWTFELAFLLSSRDSGLDLPRTKLRIPASFVIPLCFGHESPSRLVSLYYTIRNCYFYNNGSLSLLFFLSSSRHKERARESGGNKALDQIQIQGGQLHSLPTNHLTLRLDGA